MRIGIVDWEIFGGIGMRDLNWGVGLGLELEWGSELKLVHRLRITFELKGLFDWWWDAKVVGKYN